MKALIRTVSTRSINDTKLYYGKEPIGEYEGKPIFHSLDPKKPISFDILFVFKYSDIGFSFICLSFTIKEPKTHHCVSGIIALSNATSQLSFYWVSEGFIGHKYKKGKELLCRF